MFSKISPDLEVEDLDAIVEVCLDYSIYGLIVSNTTIMPQYGQGGVSGALLRSRAKLMRKEVLVRTKSTPLEVIGVGGIGSFEDVMDFWKDGGKVFQIYTAFIYQGPEILNKILNQTMRVMKKNQISSLDYFLDNIDKVDI